jgi:pimeloyl-ACP methyl ester carboxylesterase
VYDALAKSHVVIRLDHPGFGWSGEDTRIDSVHDLAFFYLDLLAELGIERVSVIGSSLGGWIGADLATIEPARIAQRSGGPKLNKTPGSSDSVPLPHERDARGYITN